MGRIDVLCVVLCCVVCVCLVGGAVLLFTVSKRVIKQ